MSVRDTAAKKLAQQFITAVQTAPESALKLAEMGAVKYPEFRLPMPDGYKGEPFGFAALVTTLRAQLAGVVAQEPAPEQRVESAPPKSAPVKRAPAARKAAAPKVAAPKVAPEPTVLRIVHNHDSWTTIYGIEQKSPAVAAIGAKGLKWGFWFAGKVFFIRGSKGFAPDMDKIGEAKAALEALRDESGHQLYRVETQIETTMPDGTPLPRKMNKEQAAQWQREYTAEKNAIYAKLGLRRGECAGCGATGLTLDTAAIVRGSGDLPVANCATCAGIPVSAPAPVAAPVSVGNLAAMLALPAAPVAQPEPESESCPCGKTGVAVVDGKFVLHSTPRGTACRVRRGVTVTDVEPESAQAPARKTAARRTSAEVGSVTLPATDLLMVFNFQNAALSGMGRKLTATDVRRELSRKLTSGRVFRGVAVECRQDKVNKRMVLTVTKGGEGHDAKALASAIEEIVKGVRGVGSRAHQAESELRELVSVA